MGAVEEDKVKKDAGVVCSGLESQQREEILFLTSNTNILYIPHSAEHHLPLHRCLQPDDRAASDPQWRLKQTSARIILHPQDPNSGHNNPIQSIQFKRARVEALWKTSKPQKDSLKPGRTFLQSLQKTHIAGQQ